MLLKLEEYGIKKGYFIKKALKQLQEAEKNGFSNVETEIIDFDRCGLQKQSTHNYKSADVLLFKSEKKLNFIEFKEIENKGDLENFIEKLDFDLKVQDSFSLLQSIVNEKTFGTKENRKKFNETENDFIFSIYSSGKSLDPRLEILLSEECLGLSDYHKSLKNVFWIETSEVQKYL